MRPDQQQLTNNYNYKNKLQMPGFWVSTWAWHATNANQIRCTTNMNRSTEQKIYFI